MRLIYLSTSNFTSYLRAAHAINETAHLTGRKLHCSRSSIHSLEHWAIYLPQPRRHLRSSSARHERNEIWDTAGSALPSRTVWEFQQTPSPTFCRKGKTSNSRSDSAVIRPFYFFKHKLKLKWIVRFWINKIHAIASVFFSILLLHPTNAIPGTSNYNR